MKAVVFQRYGSSAVLQAKDVPMPAVGEDEVLVAIRAAGANPHDWRSMRGDPSLFVRILLGLRKPRRTTVLGSDVAGQVERVGKNVTRFRPGDKVFAEVGFGGFAEYVSICQDLLEIKPANLTFAQAAAVPMTGMAALRALRKAGPIQPRQKVLINGAAGGIGTFAVQIAKSFGAEVTGVCRTRNAGLVRSIGADQVIDYTQEDFTRGGRRYDVLLDTVGNRSLPELRRVVTAKGTLVLVGGVAERGRWLGPAAQLLKGILLAPFVSQRIAAVAGKATKEDLQILRELIEARQVTPVIDRTYPLDQTPRPSATWKRATPAARSSSLQATPEPTRAQL
jgi:NADPH:quinone reductase-like Zn-dependent oxidoreductase